MTGFLGAVSDVGWSDDLQRMGVVSVDPSAFISHRPEKEEADEIGVSLELSQCLRDSCVASGNATERTSGFLRRLLLN